MASVILSALVINLASDVDAEPLTFRFGSGVTSAPSITISSSVYSGGNVRKTRQPGYQAKLSATVQAVTPAQRVLLEYSSDDPFTPGWLGETCCIRDFRGRKFYGYWDAPSIAEHGYNGECDVQLTFTQISYSETT